MNATVDIDLERRNGGHDGPGSAINEGLIDEPSCRDFLEESSRGDKKTFIVDVQGVVHVQVHIEVNVKAIVAERHCG